MAIPSTLTTTTHLPQSFTAPLAKRPEKDVPLGIDVPIVDLGQPDSVVVDIIDKACREFGVFQVVNHGVSEELMTGAMKVLREFFELPIEQKAKFYNDGKPYDMDPMFSQKAKFYAESEKNSEGEYYFWKDSLVHGTHAVTEEDVSTWPDKPETYREVIGNYSAEVRKVAIRVLDIICQGLGLPLGYFGKELIQHQMMFNNYYPPCPDPSATLGVGGHYDPNLITFLQQDLYALQFLNKNGQWIGVEPISNALVVILGSNFNVLSNEEMKGCLHRVVTHQNSDRISIATLFAPDYSSTIEPAKQLLSENKPPVYKSHTYIEYFENFLNDRSHYDAGLKPFKLL